MGSGGGGGGRGGGGGQSAALSGVTAARAAVGAPGVGTVATMKGTEKQIAWAKDVRRQALGTIRGHLDDTEKRIRGGEKLAPTGLDALKKVGRAGAKARTISSARWWIDNRSAFDDINTTLRALNK